MNEITETATPVYTGAQLNAALATTEQRIYEAAGDPGVDGVYYPFRGELDIRAARQYTTGEFSAMLNATADELDPMEDDDVCETSDTIWEQDVLNLAVNCAAYLLEHPDADLSEIIVAQYGGDSHGPVYDPDSDDWKATIPPEDPRYAPALVNEVLGWVA